MQHFGGESYLTAGSVLQQLGIDVLCRKLQVFPTKNSAIRGRTRGGLRLRRRIEVDFTQSTRRAERGGYSGGSLT
jgi:hypothetical protein